MKKHRQAGFTLVNADIVVVAERPKIAPHRAEMASVLAGVLAAHRSSISVKATTNEGFGAIGAGEAIAAMAVALLDDEVP